MGLLTAMSLFLFCHTPAVSLYLLCHIPNVIFISYLQGYTPSYSTTNSKLSFLLLFKMSWCSHSPLTVTVQTSGLSCKVCYSAGICFNLCILCAFGKTTAVLMAFRATLSGSNVIKWFGPPQQRLSALTLILFQVCTWVLWLIIHFHFFNLNMNHNQRSE